MKLVRIAAIAFLLPVLLQGCASPRSAAWHAYSHGHYADASELWSELAANGDSDAQFLLGVLYDEGQLGQADAREAVRWYALAAEAGHAPAQSNLGLCYFEGRGIARSMERAAHWFTRSAEQGFSKAQINLAVLHLLGALPESSPEQARNLLELAASHGEARAAELLAKLRELPNDAPESEIVAALVR